MVFYSTGRSIVSRKALLLLNETFFKGNIEKNLQSVEAVNKRSIEAFMDSLDSLIQSLDNGVIQI